MAQRTSGIRALLSLAPVYSGFQRIVGDDHLRKTLAGEVIRPLGTDRILDLGCGPGSMLPYMDTAEYVGLDPSERYIDSARAKFGDRGSFHLGDADRTPLDGLEGEFTIVLAIGVLHHLDDDAAAGLVDFANLSLCADGRFVAIDPCLEPGQSRVARALIVRDRGENVRTRGETTELLQRTFDDIRLDVRHDLLRIPYTHVIAECRR